MMSVPVVVLTCDMEHVPVPVCKVSCPAPHHSLTPLGMLGRPEVTTMEIHGEPSQVENEERQSLGLPPQ